MAAQKILFIASALFVQVAFGQYVTGNSVVTNQINVGNNGYNVANSGISVANSGLSVANAGYNGIALANAGINGIGLANAGLIGSNVGLIGSNVGVIGAGLSNGIGGSLLAYPNLNSIGSSGPLGVTTISPIGPSGLAVASENAIQGTLLVSGSLPFLSAVAFEGALPTAGSGVATCGCGNGAVGILSEGFPTTLPAPVYGIGSGIGGLYY